MRLTMLCTWVTLSPVRPYVSMTLTWAPTYMATPDKRTPRTIETVKAELAVLDDTLIRNIRHLFAKAKESQAKFIAKLQAGNFSHAIQWDTDELYQAQVVIDTFGPNVEGLDVTLPGQVPLSTYLENLVKRIFDTFRHGSWEARSTSPMSNLMSAWAAREQMNWLKWAEPMLARYMILQAEVEVLEGLDID